MSNKLPNFIISGFPKCGSTALHYYLKEHPEIFMPKQKELHFFTSHILAKQNQGPGDKEIKKPQIKSLKAYKNCFKNASDEKAIGDASPSYINYPELFLRIKEQLNGPKVIILLRDPVKRAFSNYLHLLREHRETLGFYEALMSEDQRKSENYSDFWYYTFNSSYSHKVLEAKRVFKDVLILTQEELNSNTEQTIRKVFDFLGVDSTYIPNNLSRRYNPGGVYDINPVTKLIFKQTPLKSAIKKIIPVGVKLKHVKHKILKKYKVPSPEIDEKSEEYLINFFKEDVKKLEKQGVDISLWDSRYTH
ncbi:sulfotransferase [Winogradskyella sp.]|uniref:sulfotransferase family protein n=1 Tax=Winogradskyella sp. TaxID=1883156 RepID=UPI00261B84E2|nr:sulfotransferase [Winogradskyella sp.]